MRPHIVFFLADDIGHANVGWHHSSASRPAEVATPHMDRLAAHGLILGRHYAFKTCTPSRAALLSGRLPVHVTQALRQPESPNAGIPRNMTGIGTVLRRAGYATHFIGKWDAGMATPAHTPRGRGFDTSLGYFEHKNDQWTLGIMQSKCLTAGGGRYANLTDLWEDSHPAGTARFAGEYEEAVFRDRALSIIGRHERGRPLFLLYASHAAHCPLQSPRAYIDHFYPLTSHDDEGLCEQQTGAGHATASRRKGAAGKGGGQGRGKGPGRGAPCPLCRGPTADWRPGTRPYQCRALYASMVSGLDIEHAPHACRRVWTLMGTAWASSCAWRVHPRVHGVCTAWVRRSVSSTTWSARSSARCTRSACTARRSWPSEPRTWTLADPSALRARCTTQALTQAECMVRVCVWQVVMCGDNGGPLKLGESAANNHPLRGGKTSDLEGGVRVQCQSHSTRGSDSARATAREAPIPP